MGRKSTLTEKQVADIRRRAMVEFRVDLAKEYNVSPALISRIKNGSRHKQIKKED